MGQKKAPTKPEMSLEPSLLQSWFVAHARACIFSLGSLSRTPWSTFMTVFVMAVAISLPLCLHVSLKNFKQLSGQWSKLNQLSVFIDTKAADNIIDSIYEQLIQHPSIYTIKHIPKSEAIESFQYHSGVTDPVGLLGYNPLPDVFIVTPDETLAPEQISLLVTELEGLSGVDLVQSDMTWVKRFYAISELVQQFVWLLAGLLAFGVLLIIANTIRLVIFSRRREIEITKLVGGTNAFICRPFLYTGLWFGVGSGVISCLIVFSVILAIRPSVNELVTSYMSQFVLYGLDFQTIISVVLCAIIIGVAGAWISVWRYLSDIEPT